MEEQNYNKKKFKKNWKISKALETSFQQGFAMPIGKMVSLFILPIGNSNRLVVWSSQQFL
jgi:hypothetical protein